MCKNKFPFTQLRYLTNETTTNDELTNRLPVCRNRYSFGIVIVKPSLVISNENILVNHPWPPDKESNPIFNAMVYAIVIPWVVRLYVEIIHEL